MSYRLSFDHPVKEMDQHDLLRKIDALHDLFGCGQQPFRPFTADHVYVIGARFQDFNNPPELSSLFSHDPKTDKISVVIRALWKCRGRRSRNEQLAADQSFRLLDSLYTVQLQDPDRARLSNSFRNILDR